MGTTKYRSGGVTVTVSGDLEKQLRSAVEHVAAGLLDALEQPASAVATQARTDWYQQVERRSGQSGDIQVETRISDDEVRVALVSPASYARYVHRPAALSTIRRRATPEEYAAARAQGLPHLRALWRTELNPKAADGKYLLQELLAKPMRLAIRKLPEQARAAILRRKP